ncbi:hypothetical protein KSC_017940 [Ktedonobacter sp. SOSP1-52]|nr:hypothetical protein KSC_017940 [Ktedonobacter sp. SOSP1-52]
MITQSVEMAREMPRQRNPDQPEKQRNREIEVFSKTPVTYHSIFLCFINCQNVSYLLKFIVQITTPG